MTRRQFGLALLYPLLIAAAGIVGDLAESMLKRDAGVKDSSTWLPGFGGVLDLLGFAAGGRTGGVSVLGCRFVAP